MSHVANRDRTRQNEREKGKERKSGKASPVRVHHKKVAVEGERARYVVAANFILDTLEQWCHYRPVHVVWTCVSLERRYSRDLRSRV